MYLFKGIRDIFENFECNFRGFGVQTFQDLGDTCSKCYMILGILFKIISGIRDTGDPLPRPLYWHNIKHTLKVWYKFSHKLN